VHDSFMSKYGKWLCKAFSKTANKKEYENKQTFIHKALCPGTLDKYISKTKNIL